MMTRSKLYLLMCRFKFLALFGFEASHGQHCAHGLIDRFTWGFGGLTPPPRYQLQPPEKVRIPWKKIPTPPQVEWHFYEIKVLEGVSEYKNS